MISRSPSTKHSLFILASLFYHAKASVALSHGPSPEPVPVPSATVKNGTINGRYLSRPWEQDIFLGIPYAQPPVGTLRFKAPLPVNESYVAPLDASEYGDSCYQYGSDFRLSEDCLTLNVIRPHHTPSSLTRLLPVLIWIHGGGLFAGSSADPQYNLSGIVRLSQDMSQPIVAVSLNYRLGVWGFLQTPELLAEGDSGGANAGLLDQRLALRWVRENIASFGGDPERVTVWGESAGAQSIALHLHSYPDLDLQSESGSSLDGKKKAKKDVEQPLFRAAILESGSAIGLPLPPLEHYTCYVDDLVQKVGCEGASDRLSCLRSVPSKKLFEAEAPAFIYPIVDGFFLPAYPSITASKNAFQKIPLLLGSNSDEGISFSPRGLNTSSDVYYALLSNPDFSDIPLPGIPYQITPQSAQKLLDLYPDNPSQSPPYDVLSNTTFIDENPSLGHQWRRAAAVYGDIVMIAGRRSLARQFSTAGEDVYSYRFATRPFDAQRPEDGVQHFVNVAYSFQNITGSLGPLPEFESHRELSRAIGQAYVNFVYWGDPNGHEDEGEKEKRDGLTLPHWPRWAPQESVNMLLNATSPRIEKDDFRKEGMAYIESIRHELLS